MKRLDRTRKESQIDCVQYYSQKLTASTQLICTLGSVLCVALGEKTQPLLAKYCGYRPLLRLSKINYQVHADPGIDSALLTKRLMILDTGASPSFLRVDMSPGGYERMLEPAILSSVIDGNRRSLRVVAQVSLCLKLEKLQARQRFFVCQQLPAPLILGCEFCDRQVDSIHAQHKEVVLMN